MLEVPVHQDEPLVPGMARNSDSRTVAVYTRHKPECPNKINAVLRSEPQILAREHRRRRNLENHAPTRFRVHCKYRFCRNGSRCETDQAHTFRAVLSRKTSILP